MADWVARYRELLREAWRYGCTNAMVPLEDNDGGWALVDDCTANIDRLASCMKQAEMPAVPIRARWPRYGGIFANDLTAAAAWLSTVGEALVRNHPRRRGAPGPSSPSSQYLRPGLVTGRLPPEASLKRSELLLGDDRGRPGPRPSRPSTRRVPRQQSRVFFETNPAALPRRAQRNRFLGTLAVVAEASRRDDDGESHEHVRGWLGAPLVGMRAGARPRASTQVPVDREPVAQRASISSPTPSTAESSPRPGGAQGIHRAECIREHASRRGARRGGWTGRQDACEGAGSWRQSHRRAFSRCPWKRQARWAPKTVWPRSLREKRRPWSKSSGLASVSGFLALLSQQLPHTIYDVSHA